MRNRVHNEWFRTVMPKRKSCPHCQAKLLPNESVWSWGEYHNAKFRRIRYFCRSCFDGVRETLIRHTNECGCSVDLLIMNTTQPDWLTLEPKDISCPVP